MGAIRVYIYLTIIALLGCDNRVSIDPLDRDVKVITTESDIIQDVSEQEKTDTAVIIVSPKAEVKEGTKETIKARERVVSIAQSQIGVREATGKNDGKEVEMYLKAVGLGKGYAWCSAFNRWVFDNAGVPTKINAWSPTSHNDKDIVYFNRKYNRNPLGGDVVCFYYANLGRIGHTGIYVKKLSNTTYESVEGNTSGTGSRDGDGVYTKYRAFNSTYSITNFIKE